MIVKIVLKFADGSKKVVPFKTINKDVEQVAKDLMEKTGAVSYKIKFEAE